MMTGQAGRLTEAPMMPSPRDLPPFATPAARWAAVRGRDARADEVFVYAVRTTGVYCRPSCPSRPARREHVSFHATPAEAERAGFRPCRRCRPNEPALAERRARAIVRACRLIERAADVPALDALAAEAGMSRFHFHRTFKAVTGVTPRAYAAAHRAGRMRRAIRREGRIIDAIYAAGFNSSGPFYAASTGTLGMTPGAFKKGAPDAAIRYAMGACALGRVLVASTTKGLCAVLLGDDDRALLRELHETFPQAAVSEADASFAGSVDAVVRAIDMPGTPVDLPLDIRGTAFQQRVWTTLRAIPAGTTASYAEVAARVGAPGSARAIAQACAANRLAVLVPCHRVVRQDGTLSGYRWGPARKRALIEREARQR